MEGPIIDRRVSPEWTARLPGFVNGHRYASVPIEEALLEVHCTAPEDSDIVRLGTLLGATDGFPAVDEQFEVSGGVGVDQDRVQSDFSRRTVGFRYRNAEGRRFVQAQPDKLVFNWLRPYESWDVLVGEFWPIWDRYAGLGHTPVVAGVRYINIIRVDKPHIEIGDYLRISIDIPPYLPQTVSSHFLQVEIPFGDNTIARVVSSLVSSDDQGPTPALLLDIAAQQRLTDGSREALKASFEHLRVVKNYVFESCITDATRRLMDDGAC